MLMEPLAHHRAWPRVDVLLDEEALRGARRARPAGLAHPVDHATRLLAALKQWQLVRQHERPDRHVAECGAERGGAWSRAQPVEIGQPLEGADRCAAAAVSHVGLAGDPLGPLRKLAPGPRQRLAQGLPDRRQDRLVTAGVAGQRIGGAVVDISALRPRLAAEKRRRPAAAAARRSWWERSQPDRAACGHPGTPSPAPRSRRRRDRGSRPARQGRQGDG